MPITGNYLHVHLISQDPRKTAEWYVEFVGGEILKEIELRGFRNVHVKLGDSLLYIRGLRSDENASPAGEGLRWGVNHLCFQVTGIEKMVDDFAAKGGEIPEPLFELPNGNRAAYLAAPDGVVMEIIELKN